MLPAVDPHLAPPALLVGIPAADEEDDPLVAGRDAFHVEGDEFAPPELTGEPDQEQGPIPDPGERLGDTAALEQPETLREAMRRSP